MAQRGRGPQKLPAGRHRLTREEVARHQRERMLEAMVRTVGETSYAATTVQDVLERAGVSRKTFYEQFASKEDCFLAAYDAVVRRVVRAVNDAYREGSSWAEGIRSGLQVLLGFVSSEPAIARTAFVEVLAAGPEALDRHRRAVDEFLPYIERGRDESPHPELLPKSLPPALAVGVTGVIHRRIAAGQAKRVRALEDELMRFILLPYLGPKRTVAELSRLSTDGRAKR